MGRLPPIDDEEVLIALLCRLPSAVMIQVQAGM